MAAVGYHWVMDELSTALAPQFLVQNVSQPSGHASGGDFLNLLVVLLLGQISHGGIEREAKILDFLLSGRGIGKG